MSVTCHFNGRLGNILFNMAQVIAYCKEYNLQWYFPKNAWACIGGRVPISVMDTGSRPVNAYIYNEPHDGKNPYYQSIPAKDNIEFRGYYQSFLYFEKYRQDVIDAIRLPWSINKGIAGMHIRRGDCVAQPDAFPMAPIEYYKSALLYMLDKGYSTFRIFSDDIEWCKNEFSSGYPECIFIFNAPGTDVEDFIALSSCEHIITARSTFSLMAAWFNQNPNKIVLCPSPEQHYWWKGQNKDMFTGTENWLTKLTW